MDSSKQKPNLLSPSKHMQDGDKRILSSLDHSVLTLSPHLPGRHYLNGWTLGLLALLLVFGLAVWLAQRADSTAAAPGKARPASADATPRATAVDSSVSSGVAHSTDQAVPSPSPPTGFTAAPPLLSLPATIINEPLITGKALHTAAHSPQDHASADAKIAQEPPHQKPLHEKITPEKTIHPPHTSAALSTTGGYTRRGAAPASARPGSEAAIAASKPSADSDVALLTALVAHSGKPAAAATDYNRDIVERSETDKTETLLQRCRQLGMIEGMLCRSRICAGRWEDDVACRAPARAP